MQNQAEYNASIAKLTERVEEQTSIDSSALALITGMSAQLKDLITRTDGIVDVSELQKLAAALDTGMRPLAAAIAANTQPAAPAPADVPPPAEAPPADAPPAS